MKFPVRAKITKSSKIILSPLRFVIHRLGIHDHHYIMPNLVQPFREMHDPNKAHREAIPTIFQSCVAWARKKKKNSRELSEHRKVRHGTMCSVLSGPDQADESDVPRL